MLATMTKGSSSRRRTLTSSVIARDRSDHADLGARHFEPSGSRADRTLAGVTVTSRSCRSSSWLEWLTARNEANLPGGRDLVLAVQEVTAAFATFRAAVHGRHRFHEAEMEGLAPPHRDHGPRH